MDARYITKVYMHLVSLNLIELQAHCRSTFEIIQWCNVRPLEKRRTPWWDNPAWLQVRLRASLTWSVVHIVPCVLLACPAPR